MSRDEQSKLEISILCRTVDEVDKEESIDETVEPITVLQRAQSRASIFFNKMNSECMLYSINVFKKFKSRGW
jgi:hypothetical protein